MNDQDDRRVLSLYHQGKFICYFSELDPFAGKWLGLSPEKAAETLHIKPSLLQRFFKMRHIDKCDVKSLK